MMAEVNRMRCWALFGCLTWSVAVCSAAVAQEDMCDPALPRFMDHQHGYRDWGDRCEGIYAEAPVSGATIGVASFTRGMISYELVYTPLTITWSDELARPVRLQAKPLRPDLFYQMDTVRPPGEGTFEWPATFLSLYQIAPRDLAVLGWVTLTFGEQEHLVHLPLTIRQGEASAEPRNYELLVVPGVELEELFIAIDHVDREGKVLAGVLERTALEYGYYPADSGVPITLPDLAGVGFYHVKLVAKRKRDGIERPEQFWFYHPTG